MQRKYIITSAVCLAGVVLDQVSKGMIRTALFPNGRMRVISGLIDFRYAENTGMAFGMLSELSLGVRIPLFSVITLVAVIIIIHLLRQSPSGSLRLPAALGLILSGAFGNLVDRFRWGVVIDFIRVQVWPPSNYYWPTFNLADSLITVGILLLVLDTLLSGEDGVEPDKDLGREEQEARSEGEEDLLVADGSGSEEDRGEQ